MIYLKQNKRKYDYDIRALIHAFYSEEKIVEDTISKKSHNGRATELSLQENDSVDLSEKENCLFTVEVIFHKNELEMIIRDEKQEWRACEIYVEEDKNIVKRVLYKILCKYSNKTLPWGTLTGIRPTKIAVELLENKKSESEVKEFFEKVYLTAEQKADISIEVAKREIQLLDNISYEKEYSLYIGIPFCPSTCLYCSFTSYPISLYKQKVQDYLNALFLEIEFAATQYKHKKLTTVYIGGGTPTSLSAEMLDDLLKNLKKQFNFSDVKEFTVEAGRPDSITKEKLLVLKKNGVSRISINPQTMKEETLKLIGRAHTVKQTIEAFYMARQVGFDNINMDIIVGLPAEDIEDIEHTLKEIMKLSPDSLTVHSLAIKRAAHLNIHMERYRSMIKGSTNEMLELVDRYAKKLDLKPYYLYRQKNIPGNLENIGYAREGKEGIYNILIMEEKQDIIALGAGASSKYVYPKENRIERVENVKDVTNYITRIEEMIQRKKEI